MIRSSGTFDTPKVHVIDDDDGFRTSVTRVLNAAGFPAKGYRCAGEFLLSDAANRPGCVVLDIFMPGPSGVELLDALATRESAPPIIFLTGCNDVSTCVRAMKLGAIDFLTKPVETARLLQSVAQAIALDATRRRARREGDELQQRYALLTSREKEVLLGVARGSLNKRLAVELNTCERTIKTYRARMMEKLGLETLADVVRAASLLGLGGEPAADVPIDMPVAATHGALSAARAS